MSTVYSFALNPGNYAPIGSYPFSRIDNVNLCIRLDTVYLIRIYCIVNAFRRYKFVRAMRTIGRTQKFKAELMAVVWHPSRFPIWQHYDAELIG
jgi:hypothetical protein